MENLLPILGLSFIGSVAGLVGGVIFLFKKEWSKALSIHAIPFAAGVLLAVSLLDLIPEAIEKSNPQEILSVVLLVIVSAFFFEQFFLHIHHHEERGRTTIKSSLPLVVVGDTIHNFIDGLAIASAYFVEPGLGILVALATFLHETPHEMGDFGLMLAGGWTRKKAIQVNFFSALATFVGAILVVLFSQAIKDNFAILLAVAGGLFLYIGASDLLPEVQEEHKDEPWHQAALLLAGVIIIFILTRFLPE